jgi:hypothetical protein
MSLMQLWVRAPKRRSLSWKVPSSRRIDRRPRRGLVFCVWVLSCAKAATARASCVGSVSILLRYADVSAPPGRSKRVQAFCVFSLGAGSKLGGRPVRWDAQVARDRSMAETMTRWFDGPARGGDLRPRRLIKGSLRHHAAKLDQDQRRRLWRVDPLACVLSFLPARYRRADAARVRGGERLGSDRHVAPARWARKERAT